MARTTRKTDMQAQYIIDQLDEIKQQLHGVVTGLEVLKSKKYTEQIRTANTRIGKLEALRWILFGIGWALTSIGAQSLLMKP